MNKYIILLGIVGLFLWSGCSDDEGEVYPTRKTKYWLEIKDEPGELNQLRYKLYKEYGISLFVNDTIGSENRGTDAYGQPIIYHEILKPGYAVTSTTEFEMHLSSDTAAMIKLTELMLDFVAPRLPKGIEYKPYAYLLCDVFFKTLPKQYSHTGFTPDTRYTFYPVQHSLMVTSISLSDVGMMDEGALKDLGARILGNAVYHGIENNYSTELDEFYAITNEGETKSPYGLFAVNYKATVPEDGWLEKLYEYSFLHAGVCNIYYNINMFDAFRPTTTQDVEDYVGAVYAYTETEFEALYGQYDKMMRKFKLMKSLVERFKTEILGE